MAQRLSTTDFGALVNASVNAVTNNTTIDKMSANTGNTSMADSTPKKMFSDELDTLDDLDGTLSEESFDDLDDLVDFDDLDSTEPGDVTTESVTAIENESAGKVQDDLPSFLKFKSIEDTSDKIPDYTSDLYVEAGETPENQVDTIKDAIITKMNDAFLITDECNDYQDLWNVNFIAAKTSSDLEAFERLLAMFYHIYCVNVQVVKAILQDNSLALLDRLCQLGRILYIEDITGDADSESMEEVSSDNNDSVSDYAPVVSYAEDSTASESSAVMTAQENGTAEKIKSPTTKTGRKMFAAMLPGRLLSENEANRIQSVDMLKNCYYGLCNLYCDKKLEQVEFLKFVMFLAKTRDVILDLKLVQDLKTFNCYWAYMLSRACKMKEFHDGLYHDSFIICNDQNSKSVELPMDFLAFNWRLFQLRIRKFTGITDDEIDGRRLLCLQWDTRAKCTPANFSTIKSSYSLFAEDFCDAVTSHLHSAEATETFNFVCSLDDYNFYTLCRAGLDIPASFRMLTAQQRSSLGLVLEYIIKEHQELFSFVVGGRFVAPWSVRLTSLLRSNSDLANSAKHVNLFTSSTYQLLAHAISKACDCEIHLMRVYEECDPAIVLYGDGVKDGTTFSVQEFLGNFDQIIEHARSSKQVQVCVKQTKLHIIFKK